MSISYDIAAMFDSEGSDNDQTDISNTPPHLLEEVKKIDIVPEKSRPAYDKVYENYCIWKEKHQIQKSSANVISAYILELQKNYQPSSIWTKISMLKTILMREEQFNVDDYPQIKNYLKKISKKHKPKKAYVFSQEDFLKFLRDAPNDYYLVHKICLILGFYGLMRGGEMYSMELNQIKALPEGDFLIEFGSSKTDPGNVQNFCFVIPNERDSDTNPAMYLSLYLDFIKQRKKEVTYLFSQIRDGKLHCQRLGRTFFLKKGPNDIAVFLKKPSPEKYTGHSFRRSGATNAAENGAMQEDLKRLGRWRSNSVAEGYVQESVASKKRLAS